MLAIAWPTNLTFWVLLFLLLYLKLQILMRRNYFQVFRHNENFSKTSLLFLLHKTKRSELVLCQQHTSKVPVHLTRWIHTWRNSQIPYSWGYGSIPGYKPHFYLSKAVNFSFKSCKGDDLNFLFYLKKPIELSVVLLVNTYMCFLLNPFFTTLIPTS